MRSSSIALAISFLAFITAPSFAQVSQKVNANVQPKMVKIFGSGGFANLHAHQTGFFFSNNGKLITVWSHVLEGKTIVYDSAGRRHAASFVGYDPETELAILKIENYQSEFFDLKSAFQPTSGMKLAAFSNLFGIATKNESLSVMSGVVAAITNLDSKLGQFNTPYKGRVIILDLITNNPGAAGGAVVDHQGRLIGMIGKELKDRNTGLWLNFCIPADVILNSISKIENGETNKIDRKPKVASPLRLVDLGIELIPNVVETTQPYVDHVVKESSAESAGIEPDDLLLFISGQAVRSVAEVQAFLGTLDRDESIEVIIRRKDKLVTYAFSSRTGWQLVIPDQNSNEKSER